MNDVKIKEQFHYFNILAEVAQVSHSNTWIV